MRTDRSRISQLVSRKMDRLSNGHSPRVLDLFSGCGGLMLGFDRAGCVSVAGLDIDVEASRSYAANFHSHEDERLLSVHASPKDITAIPPADLLKDLGYHQPGEVVDLLVGGPPCPTFTRVGRAKLREVQDHPQAFQLDPRAKLYLPYLRYAKELAPVAVMMENVPDFLNWGGHNLAEEICEILEDLGYVCAYTLLNASNYGVPQMRERMFLLAVHRNAEVEPTFPLPTRFVDFPAGYEGSRDVALKSLRSLPLFAAKPRYVPPPKASRNAPPPVTVREAIGDLPPITGHLEGKDKRGARRFDKAVEYRDIPLSDYMLEMRTWPGFSASGVVWDHVTRCLGERDYRLFRQMKPGDDYPRAHALARELFLEEVDRIRRTGKVLKESSSGYKTLYSCYVPPYDPGKFPNKWRKMDPDEPARTLMAHLGKDSYTHIHYDSDQARVLSVREAARLQSFPDGFKFSGTMNPAFRQIGNAVPPLMAFHLAKELLGLIGVEAEREESLACVAP